MLCLWVMSITERHNTYHMYNTTGHCLSTNCWICRERSTTKCNFPSKLSDVSAKWEWSVSVKTAVPHQERELRT